MLDELKAYIEQGNLLSPSDRILVGVSGGVDSMVLVSMLKRLHFDIQVAHMNFQLRGGDSDEDEKLVYEWCNEHSVPFHVKKVKLDLAGPSVQMAAREARYSWFDELVKVNGLTKIATAHHLDDSLETVLLNLSKGTGLTGLKGISASRDVIVRPLLCLSKETILEFAGSEGIVWREDASNQKNDYQRNLVRNEVIPLLKEINPNLIETFERTTRRLSASETIIQSRVDAISESISGNQKEINVPLDWVKGDPTDAELLYRVLRPNGFSYQVCEQILESKISGKVFLADKYVACLDRNRLIITKRAPEQDQEIWISGSGGFRWREKQIKVSLKKFDGEISDAKNTVELDARQINWPVMVRSWQKGDTFQPLGMSGKKKVSDFMIDLKIPVTLKQDIPIFVSGNKIIWVGGYRIDERFKISEDTTDIVRIELLDNG